MSAISERGQERRAAPCHYCGATDNIKAVATKGGETRYFCHDDQQSCYVKCQGRYFEDD